MHFLKLTKHRLLTFNLQVKELVDRTLKSCRSALRQAKLKKTDIDNVVMVGGSTRVPLVRQVVSEFFGRDVLTNINPDEVVAVGAALQADVLAGNKPDSDMLLLDVNPLSLGIETHGGLVEQIIPRNGLLTVSAIEKVSEVHAEVQIKPSYGLLDSEIETMIRDSMTNAEQDVAARMLQEQRVEAEKSGENTDADAIKAALRQLESVSEVYVARRMNASIGESMTGQHIDSYEQQDNPS